LSSFNLFKICIVILFINNGGRGNGKTPYCPRDTIEEA